MAFDIADLVAIQSWANRNDVRMAYSFAPDMPLAGIVSILHRVSGLALFVLLPFIIWLFDLSVSSEVSFERFTSVFSVGVGPLPGVLQACYVGAGADVALAAAGVPVDHRTYGSLVHAFANFFPLGGDSATACADYISAFRAHLTR